MSEGIVNLYTVFFLGMSVSLIVLEVVRLLPFDNYFKIILLVVLPLPVFCMALVLMFYGPASFRESAVAQYSPASLVKSFMSGAFWSVVLLGLLHAFLVMREEE
jgi:hypothetical protein